MQIAQHQKIQNYLLWLQERGQCWPIIDTLHKEVQESSKPHELEQMTPSQVEPTSPEATAQPQAKASSSIDLFRSAGNEQAPFLGIVDCIKGQKLVFGQERALLIKILSALGIEIKTQFRLLGLETDHCCAPLASSQDYQQQFWQQVNRSKPKAIFCFGRLPYQLISGDRGPFSEKVNSQSFIKENTPPMFTLYHLCELLNSPDLKKRTWHGLKGFMENL